MITKHQKANAERIEELADYFGSFLYNASQTVDEILNLTIPCARLINAGIVTGVVDSYDAVNDHAVEDMERYCKTAIDYMVKREGSGWWTDTAQRLGLS